MRTTSLRRSPRSTAGHRRAGRHGGFTLVESLVAMAILLILVIGVLPLFTQSMVNNSSGRQATSAANFTSAAVEELYQVPFNHEDLSFAGGNALRVVELFDEDHNDPMATNTRIVTETATPEDYHSILNTAFTTVQIQASEWARITTVRQYGVNALADGQLTVDEQLPGDALESFVQLKQIEVQVVSALNGTPYGQSGVFTVRALKTS